ncbi:heterogeneous nuclear ribonucleoprotein D-like isoform X2 [Herrania umbratica]|uniref:Heterogeneous nuclear ribonucleoprotein D-like isoform X2 n=1 Tax=Herrania umbratica TaxID=108875 RepID=A0A6J1BJN2_9ROSI|nr:heterogeneous nuclear ribonucleoprotein D-like isoform X2 [Herrania umbratica]
MGTRDDDSFPTGRRGSPGKIFIGGIPRETTRVQFFKHFHKYGEIKDSVIMLDPRTGIARGFGFVTYENPSVIDKVIEDAHVINGKQVVIKRTIPKGVVGTKDFKTRRTFISGIPSRLTEDEFKDLFKQFGEVKEHGIVRDNNASFLGFGFITFGTEQSVDDLLAKRNKVELDGGSQILLHKVYARWERPPRRFFKLNSDGSSAGNPGKAGAGGIIRNDQGEWIVGYSRKLGQATSTCAELWGVRDGLQLAVKRGLFYVIIEVDSQVVLDLICKEAVDSHTLGPIIKECRSLLEQIPNHRFCQINRDSNSCADHLARMGATMTKDFVIFEFPPDCVRLLLFAESLEPEDNDVILGGETNEFKSLNHTKDDDSLPQTKCGASPGYISFNVQNFCWRFSKRYNICTVS